MSILWYDLLLNLRTLTKRPAYCAVVVFTLALGIGASTAIFTVVNGVLLQPLPYVKPTDLLRVYGKFEPISGFDFAKFPLSNPEYIDLRNSLTKISELAAFTTRGVTVTGDGVPPEPVFEGLITPTLLPLLGISPVIGRGFSEEEGLPGAEAVALVSSGFARDRFNGLDPLGQTLRIDGVDHAVIGVLGEGFDFPDPRARIWRPIRIDPKDPGGRWSHSISALARLAPGAVLPEARAEMETLMGVWKEEYPDIHTGHYVFLTSMQEDMIGGIRPALLALLAAAGLLLLVVCANVASLVLARGEERSREIALRTALGAGKLRLLRVSIGESLILAFLGGLLGLVCSMFGTRYLLRLGHASIPRSQEVAVDPAVIVFTILVSAAVALLCSLGPALRSPFSTRALIEGLGRGSVAPKQSRGQRWLVTAEVAICFVLVLGAGLLIRSLDRLLSVDTGFRPRGTLVAGVSLSETDYPEVADVQNTIDEIVDRAQALPGVVRAAEASTVPLWSDQGVWDFDIEGAGERTNSGLAYNAVFGAAGAGYFETLGFRLISGRTFEHADNATSEPVAIVNEEFARRFLPADRHLGLRIRVSGGDHVWSRIVGIVSTSIVGSLDEDPQAAYFLASSQLATTLGFTRRFRGLVLQTEGDPRAYLEPLRGIVRAIDPNLPLIKAQTMPEVITGATTRQRFTATLLGAFGAVSLLLGAVGIYGVLACAVSQRTREFGMRSALGARPAQLLTLVYRQGLGPVLLGIALGIVISLGVGRLLRGLLFGVESTDLFTYATVIAVLMLAGVVACLAPAWRATRLDPLQVLRAE